MINKESTIKEMAAEFGISMGTVAKKAKDAGIRIKGRSDKEHEALAETLKAVRPKPRKAAKKLTVFSPLDDIKRGIAGARLKVAELDAKIDALKAEKEELLKALEELKA